MDPCDWGWQVIAGKLLPVMSDLKPAPQSLLKITRCSCKSDFKMIKCTCRKLEPTCSSVCVWAALESTALMPIKWIYLMTEAILAAKPGH